MKAETAYQFLKASIEEMTDKERVKLAEMILPSKTKIKTRKKLDSIPSNEYFRRKLLESGFFKSGPGISKK